VEIVITAHQLCFYKDKKLYGNGMIEIKPHNTIMRQRGGII